MKLKIFLAIVLLIISNYTYAEQYRFEPPNSINAPCAGAVYCGSYFQFGFIEVSPNGSNSSKITLNFSPSLLEEDNETFLYILTLAYEAAVSDISFYNVEPIGAIPAQANNAEYESKIPGAIAGFAEGNIAGRLGAVGKMLPYIKIATALLDPVPLSRDPSILYNLPTNSTLDKELYPYHSFYQFFNRSRGVASTVTFTINKSVNELRELIRTKKMSVYIGGNKENEFLVEGLSTLVLDDINEPPSGGGGNDIPDVELNQNGRWISSGGRNPNTFRNIKYDFTLESAGNISIGLDTTRANDAYLYVLNSQGEVVASDDDAGGDRDSLIDNHSLSAGNYTIVAATYNVGVTGDFSLTVTGAVSDFHRNLPSDGGDNSIPDVELSQNGHWISSGGRNPNTFRNIKYDFTLESAGNISIGLDTTRANDAYLYVLNSQGEIVASDDDAGGDRDSLIDNHSLSAGNYTIVAATYNAGVTGDFSLTVTGAVSNFHQNLP